MQRHKELYKEQSLVLSPRNHCQENRDRLQAARAKKREDCFYQNRIISVSPTPVKAKQSVAAQGALPQENVVPNLQGQQQPELEKKEPLEQPPQPTAKPTRQSVFLKRYTEWKNARNKEHKHRDQTRRGAAIKAPPVNQLKTFPKSETFRVPENLATTKQKEAVSVLQPTKRCSLYVIANPISKIKGKASEATNPSKAASSVIKPTPAALLDAKTAPAAPPLKKPAAPSSKHETAAPAIKPGTVALARQKAASATKPTRQTTNPVALARQKAAARPAPTATSNTRERFPATEGKKVSAMPISSAVTLNKGKTDPVRHQPSGISLKPRVPVSTVPRVARLANVMSQPFEKPSGGRATVNGRANVVKPQSIRGGGGAVGKFKDSAGVTSKTVGNSMRMKPTKQKNQYTKLQDNVRKLPQLKAELLQAALLDIPPLTPLEEIPFLDQATSTQCKAKLALT